MEIHCKKHLSTPKTAAKTTKPIADMTEARHSSMLPGSKNWRQGGHHRDIYKYTAISRRVVGKKCPRQTRKVIWDKISVTSWHCSCRTYFKFSQLSGAISLLNQDVSRGNGGFSLTGLCKKLKNRGRVYSPWKGRAEVCALPATCVVNFHIFSLNWEVFWLSKKKLNQIWLLVSLKEQGLSPWSIVYCYQVSQWRCPVSEVSQVLGFLMTPISCILVLPNNNCSRFKSFEGF